MQRHWGSTAVATLAVAALTACASGQTDPGGAASAPTPTSAAPSSGAVGPAGEPRSHPPMRGEPEAVVQGLEAPWSIVFRGDTALVSERDSGRILELTDDGGTRDIGVVPEVVHGGEGGLLGLALQDGDWLYAYSTGKGGNRIQRFELSGTAGSLALGKGTTLLEGIPAGPNHNGGRLAFGPDGMLYATTGDAGERSHAQDLDSLAGKILRMTPDGKIPEDNPFPGSYVYSYGHRNPQGLGWTLDERMYATEFGQNTWDELNVITAGANYGWPTVEGIANRDGFVDPVQQWEPAAASPSGMALAGGTIFIANLRGAALRTVPLADTSVSTEHYVGEFGRLRDAVIAPDGDLWFLTNNTDGRGSPGPDDDMIYRVDLADR
ncbi:sorbosone dehydrogenase family protein [Arthrobacter sp. JSM 101049]|uniref:PQQ-dependent sugar dehydrogenase n=1 Tax=Arthrobacter sp. JSM 101049 TaxID=929097 RepID=UPI0035637109